MEIKLGKLEAQGFAETAPSLIVMRAPLQPAPNARWKHLLEANPHFTGWPRSLQGPRVYEDEVEIHAPEDSIEMAVTALRERIAWANQQYEQRVKPQLEARDRATAEAKARREKRLSEAQRRIDETA